MSLSDIRIDRMRERKFRADLKARLAASGLSVTISVDGLIVEWPSGERAALTVSNRTGTRYSDGTPVKNVQDRSDVFDL